MSLRTGWHAADLLAVPDGPITERGLRVNINVGLRYLESWLRGLGCVPIFNLMEDAATAEICRAQVWQWVKHGAQMNDGRTVAGSLVSEIVRERSAHLYGEKRQALAAVVMEPIRGHAPDPGFRLGKLVRRFGPVGSADAEPGATVTRSARKRANAPAGKT